MQSFLRYCIDMAEAVKRTRRYNSPRRREQAAQTRRAILDAARWLFERDGYAATSVPVIAAEAGVALKTVYVVFETKANLLRSLWNEHFAGEEADVPVTRRAWYREMIEEPGDQRQLRLLAAHSRLAKTRSGPLMEVIRDAAAIDDDIARLWDEIEAKLVSVARAVVEKLHDKGALVPGLDVGVAADILWTVTHPSVWRLLGERGWSPDQYEEWLGRTLGAQLLGKIWAPGRP